MAVVPASWTSALRGAGLPWPLPALGAWALAWAAAMATAWQLGPGAALAAGLAVGVLAAAGTRGGVRRLWVAAGFPASAFVLGLAPALPGWAWAAALLALLLAYPLGAWRDAPFFPTPPGALDALPGLVGQPRRVLEAGCGAGHGLAALRRAFPAATLVGIEKSPLLAPLARWRQPGAEVRRGDLWHEDWAGYELVYLFQRPESMARAWHKAQSEMAPGSWLVSLEFAVPDAAPVARLPVGEDRALWLYRVGGGRPGPLNARRSRPITHGNA